MTRRLHAGWRRFATFCIKEVCSALPEFFKHKDELRRPWSNSDTRRQLLAGLADTGFGRDALAGLWPPPERAACPRERRDPGSVYA